MFPEPFLKVLADSPMYSSSHSSLSHLYLLLYFSVWCCPVLGGHQEVLDGTVSPKMDLDPILPHMFLKVLLKHLEWGTTIWMLLRLLLLLVLFLWLLVLWLLFWACLMLYMGLLIWSLFEVQIGYLHLSRALPMCSSSFCSSCTLVQTVLDLCVRVPKTLHLEGRLWWLSQWRYRPVWVRFMETEVSSLLSGPGVT